MAQHHTSYTLKQELANSISHGFGILFGIVCMPILIATAAQTGSKAAVAGTAIYGFSFIMVYTFSTLYHGFQQPEVKRVMKIIDHISIYFLIAGSYTPFTLIGLREHGGWWLFGIVWILALAGVIFKLYYTGRFKLVSTLIYIGMGWMVIFAIKPMLQNIDMTTLIWLFTGGLFYTLGTVFYMSKKIRYTHTIWHVFVMLGSASHFVAISRQVLL